MHHRVQIDSAFRLAGRCALGLVAVAPLAMVGCGTAQQLSNALSTGRTGHFGAAQDGLNVPGAAPAPDAAPGAGGAAEAVDQVVRDIEEADVVKIVGDRLYVLNRYKGLLIIDVSDPDSPLLLGRVDLRGRGVEMYVVGPRAYVLLSADYYYMDALPGAAGGAAGTARMSLVAPGPHAPPPDFEGSQIAIIDVNDPNAPAMLDKLNLAGFADASRRVGDVIYVVGSNNLPWYNALADDSDLPPVNEGFVASVNVANPNDIQAVDRETFSGAGLSLHVSQTALFAASQRWQQSTAQSITRVQYVDISDPAGAIVLRDSFDVPGFIRNRFYMDDFEGVFRIATESSGFGFREVKVFTYSLADPADITPLGSVDVIRGESLEAVRFDGPRGYVVTFLRVDPLFVIDLRDPATPSVSGELEVPGYSTHIEPRGDRLIAVGIDNTDGTRPALAYYDVSDPANPTELDRIVLGPPGSFTESNATYDEKAFKIIDELGLIAMPFRHVDYQSIPSDPRPLPGFAASGRDLPYVPPQCVDAVQLVDFSDAGLTKRGWFNHRGRVERVGLVANRVFALSQVALQTVDIADRDDPQRKAMLNFFAANEEPPYADDCWNGWVWVEQPPWQFDIVVDLPRVIQIMLNGELCGTITFATMAGLSAGLFFVRHRVRVRRRVRR